jgi:hypothetical protein
MIDPREQLLLQVLECSREAIEAYGRNGAGFDNRMRRLSEAIAAFDAAPNYIPTIPYRCEVHNPDGDMIGHYTEIRPGIYEAVAVRKLGEYDSLRRASDAVCEAHARDFPPAPEEGVFPASGTIEAAEFSSNRKDIKLISLDTDRIDAPWTAEQVASLTDYQKCSAFHPYTCRCRMTLIPTPNGWSCRGCRWEQGKTAMRFTLDGSWRKHADAFLTAVGIKGES